MNVKILIFPDNRMFISQITSLATEVIGDPDILLTEPFEIQIPETNLLTESVQEFNLTPWLLQVTTQNTFQIHSDKLLTMAEPNPKLLKKYKEIIS